MSKRTGNPIGRRRKHSYDVIAEMYAAGLSTPAVARKLGLHYTTVLYALNKQGIDTSLTARHEQAVRVWEKKYDANRVIREVARSAAAMRKARTDFLEACKQAKNRRIERMMSLACPKRKRYAA